MTVQYVNNSSTTITAKSHLYDFFSSHSGVISSVAGLAFVADRRLEAGLWPGSLGQGVSEPDR